MSEPINYRTLLGAEAWDKAIESMMEAGDNYETELEDALNILVESGVLTWEIDGDFNRLVSPWKEM